MKKGLGITALVLSIIAFFTPVIGPWLTIIIALLAAFSYGDALGLGIAAILLNIVNIVFLSPSIWAHGALVSTAAKSVDGTDIVFFPWIVLGAQVIGLIVLIALHAKTKNAKTGAGAAN